MLLQGLEELVRELGKRGQALRFMGLPQSALRLVAGLDMKGFAHCAAPRDLPDLLLGDGTYSPLALLAHASNRNRYTLVHFVAP